MSPRRFLIELLVMCSSIGGAAIGYCAGQQFEQSAVQISLAFLGMALAGAFTEICLRGGAK